VRAIDNQLFLRRDAKLPGTLRLQGQPIDADWLALPGDAYALDQQVRAGGWHFFWLTETMGAWAIGIRRETAAGTALRKALKKIAPSRNVAEVIKLRHRSLCGLQLCQVCLAVRHIQPEMILSIAPSVGMISSVAEPERWIKPSAQTQQLAA
jgi:hypothetical protein